MSAQPPPGYDPSVSKLEGAGAESVPIIKMSGGGLTPEPPQNYIDGGYKNSLLEGSSAEVPMERQSGGGKELLDQLQITEEEFEGLDVADLSFDEFKTQIEKCNGPEDLEGTDCTAVRDALKTLFINRLRSYIEECKGFTAGEGEGDEFGLGPEGATGLALPPKLIYDQAKKIWRSPRAYEDEGAAVVPEKGQWIPKGDGTWVPATPSTVRGAPGTAAGPKYMREFPKGSGTFVPATQADVGAIPVTQGQEWKKVVSKSVFGTKETWMPPETEKAVAKRLEGETAREDAAKIKSTEPLKAMAELIGAPTREAPGYPTPKEAAANYAKVKVLFDLINFLPTIYKGIPQPNTQVYEYKTLSELIRATAAIIANILPSMRTPERTKELETFKISTAFPNLTKTIGTSLVMDKDAKNRIDKFIIEHQDVFNINTENLIEIFEGIYTQLLNFISDIGNLKVYNRLRTDARSITDADTIAEKFFPKLTDPGIFSRDGKANYISIFYQNPNPVSVPTEQYGTTLFAYRIGMSYVSKELIKTEIPVGILDSLSKAMPIKIDTFNFSSLMKRFFSNYGPISEEDVKLFDLIHKDISGFDMLFNLFIKHDANPFTSFANAANPEGKFAADKDLKGYVTSAINEFYKLINIVDVDPGTEADPNRPLFGDDNDDIFTKLLERVGKTVDLGFTFNDYMRGFDAIFGKLDDKFITRVAGQPLNEEGIAQYRKLIDSFVIVCNFLTTVFAPRNDAVLFKNMYQDVFGKIYSYYIRMKLTATSPVLQIIGGNPIVEPIVDGDPTTILTSSQVNEMEMYLKEIFSSSEYYVGNIFELMFARYLKNSKKIISILPAGVDAITSEATLYATLQHFKSIISLPAVPAAGPGAAAPPAAPVPTPLQRIFVNLPTGGPVRNAYTEIFRADNPDLIKEYKRNPVAPAKLNYLRILFEFITAKSAELTAADIIYLNGIKDTLFMNNYKKAVEDLFFIHASLKKQYPDYSYDHKPIDRFYESSTIEKLNKTDYFMTLTFDVIMLLDQLNQNVNKIKDPDLYNKSRSIVLQFMQPYLEQSIMDLLIKMRDMTVTILTPEERDRLEVKYTMVVPQGRGRRAVADPELQIEFNEMINNVMAIGPQIEEFMRDLQAPAGPGRFVYTTVISNFISDRAARTNVSNRILEFINLFAEQTAMIQEETNYKQTMKDITNYANLFAANTKDSILAILQALREAYRDAPYHDASVPTSEAILTAFYKPSERDNNRWERDVFNKMIANPADLTYTKYFGIMTSLKDKGVLPDPLISQYNKVPPFFVYSIEFKAEEYLGSRPGVKDDVDENTSSKLNAFEVSGVKFVDYPVDILYGAPGSDERKNFIQLIIALLSKLVSLIILDSKTTKERITSFFYLMNQFELVLYSIGEQENTNFTTFKELFNIPVFGNFMKLGYEKYYKDTKLGGKDFTGFDTKKVIRAIGEGQWVQYPYREEIKTWFGGGSGSDQQIPDINMKGGFFVPPYVLYILGGTGGLLSLAPVRSGLSRAGNWITSFMGSKPITIDTRIDPRTRRIGDVAGDTSALTTALQTTFASDPNLLISIQKKLLFDPQFGLGNDSIKKMVQELNIFNIPINITALPDFGGNLFTNAEIGVAVNKFMIPPAGAALESSTFITHINDLFPNIAGLDAQQRQTWFGLINRFISGPVTETGVGFKNNEIKAFIVALDKVIAKFRLYFKKQCMTLDNNIKTIESEIYETNKADPSAERDRLVAINQDKIKELKTKKNLAVTYLLSLGDIRNNPFLKMKNVMSATFSNQQFPEPAAAAAPGAVTLFDIPKIPDEVATFNPKIRINMRDPVWKMYAVDAILYIKKLYEILTTQYSAISLPQYLRGKDYSKIVELRPISGDPLLNFTGIDRINATKDRYSSLASKFINNDMLNSDRDIQLLINTFGGQISADSADVIPDRTQRLFVAPRTNVLEGYFCSPESLKLYAYSKTNVINAMNVIKEYVAFNKALFQQFKELFCILADADVKKNPLLESLATNPIIAYMNSVRIAAPTKVKGAPVKLDDKAKKDINGKLNDCFKTFLSSQDPYEYGELISVLHFITTKPMNAKLDKAFKQKTDKLKNAAKVLRAYCEYDIEYVAPSWYGLPTQYIAAPMPPRQRFKMFDQPEEEVEKYNLVNVKHQEFIANRQLFNLLYDSILSRHKFYNKHVKNIADRQKKDTINLKVPKIPKIETNTDEELKYLASVLYAYGVKAREEILPRLADNSPEKELVKTFAGYTFTGGEGLQFSEEELDNLSKRIDITRLDIQAPPYMFLTPQQRVFACEKAMAKIHELTYEQVNTLLITLLGSYETQGIDSDDIVTEKNKTLVVKPITSIDPDSLERLRTASLVIRYNGNASHFLDNNKIFKYQIKGMLQVPENYKCFLNIKYGKIDIKTLAEIDPKAAEQLADEEAVDLLAFFDAAEAVDAGEDAAAEGAAVEPEPLVEPLPGVAPNVELEGGGANDPLIVHNRTRRGSKHNSNYRLTARREHVNREHNKHTRKNK